MKNIPDKIYLQLGEDIEDVENFDELNEEDVLWCQVKCYSTDLEYLSLQEVKSIIAKSVKIVKEKAVELYYDSQSDADIDNLIRGINVQEIVNEIFQ